nr:hypothetical protein [Tanacetum cinerariifolium]
EFDDFLTLYPIPSEYRVILPKSNQTIFDAPHGYIGLYTHLFSFENLRLPLIELFYKVLEYFQELYLHQNDEDLAFLPKEPSPGFGTGSLYILVNTEPLKTNEEPMIQPVEVTTDFGESPKPELFVVHLGSHPDVLELKDDTACHLKIFVITPLAWKNHLDNHIDLELLDLHDRCYTRQAVVDNAVNRTSHELLQVIKKIRGELDVTRNRETAKEEECEGLRVKCEATMTEFLKNPTMVPLWEKIFVLSTEELYLHQNDKDLAFLPKEPSPGFGTGSPYILVNTEPLKTNEEPMIQPVEVTTDFGESPKPELFVVHLGSVASRIKDRPYEDKVESFTSCERSIAYRDLQKDFSNGLGFLP